MQKRILASGLGALLALPLLAACSNTAGVEANDYSVFRIASVSTTKESGDCGPDDPNPPTEVHKSTFRVGGTFLTYGITDPTGDQLYLDTGDRVMAGALQADGSYLFSGSESDSQLIGGMTIQDSDHDGIDDSTQSFVDADNDGLNDKDSVTDSMVDVDQDGLDDRFEDNLVDSNHDGIDDRIVQLPGNTKVTDKSDVVVSFLPNGEAIAGTAKTTHTTSCSGECTGFDGIKCTNTGTFVGIEINDPSVSVPVGGDSD